MRCHNCGSDRTESEAASGVSFCVDCGTVLEENTIVSEITFGETSGGKAILQGSYAGESGRISGGGLFGRNRGREGQEQAIENGRVKIASLAHAIRLPERYRESAQRYYNLAVVNRFTRGRRSDHVAAVCLYAVCRTEKSSQMLIDFSDILQVNVFTLGATFLKLCRVLNLTLPHVDPSLYISRFAVALDFGDYTQRVAQDAVRIAQRMDRDWITSGRRPAGICGACLLIAARINGFRRTTKEMIYVVKVAEVTIQKRLYEFNQTESAQLSVRDFRTIWLEKRADPPSFQKNRKMAEDEEEQDDRLGLILDSIPDSDDDVSEDEKSELKELAAIAKEKIEKEESELLNPELEKDAKEIADEMENWLGDESVKKAAEELEKEKKEDEEMKEEEEEEEVSLSDVDCDEIEAMILTPDEVKLKTKVWYTENKDYLEEMAVRRMIEKDKTSPYSRKGRQKNKKKAPAASTPAEAAKQLMVNKKLSKKINQAVFDDMFESPESIAKIKAREAVKKLTGSPVAEVPEYEVVEEPGEVLSQTQKVDDPATQKAGTQEFSSTAETAVDDDDEDEMDSDDMADDERFLRDARANYTLDDEEVEDYGEDYDDDY